MSVAATRYSVSRGLSRIFSILLMLAWPLLVWQAVLQPQLRWLPLLLLLFFLLRLRFLPRLRNVSGAQPAGQLGNMLAISGAALCLTSYLLRDHQLLAYYPVAVNGALLLLFAGSLFHGKPLAEQLARWRDPCLPAEALPYTRCVTQVWCLFFIGNGAIALATCLAADMRLWLLWNGLISYLLGGLLFGAEWLIRQRVIRGQRVTRAP